MVLDMKNRNILDQKIGALFDKAFTFRLPPHPDFGDKPEEKIELELSELDMLSAAGKETDIIDIRKKLKNK